MFRIDNDEDLLDADSSDFEFRAFQISDGGARQFALETLDRCRNAE